MLTPQDHKANNNAATSLKCFSCQTIGMRCFSLSLLLFCFFIIFFSIFTSINTCVQCIILTHLVRSWCKRKAHLNFFILFPLSLLLVSFYLQKTCPLTFICPFIPLYIVLLIEQKSGGAHLQTVNIHILETQALSLSNKTQRPGEIAQWHSAWLASSRS